MAVMVPRETVTEHRLDVLEKKVDEGFARLDKKIDDGLARVDKRIDEGFAAVDKRFKQIDERFGRLEDRMMRLEDGFFALNRTLSIGAITIVAALVGSNFF
jgi:hypothetical protein